MIFLQEGIGVNVVNAATFPQNDTSAIFHNFRNLDGIVQQISMVTIHHFFNSVDVTRKCQCGGECQSVLQLVIVTQRGFPSAVLHITGLQVNLLVTGKFRQVTQESLVLGIGMVVSDFCTQLVPQTQT